MGAAIAKKLSGPNIEIVIHYNKSRSKAENLKKDLTKSGTKIYLAKADLTKEKEIERINNSVQRLSQTTVFVDDDPMLTPTILRSKVRRM